MHRERALPNTLLNHPIPRLRRVRASFRRRLVARDPSDLVLDDRFVAERQIVRLGRAARPCIGIPHTQRVELLEP